MRVEYVRMGCVRALDICEGLEYDYDDVYF